VTEINDFVLEEFYKIITPNKVEMFDRIAADRTKHLTVALENIYQEHNAKIKETINLETNQILGGNVVCIAKTLKTGKCHKYKL
jgi:hypothetical protein